MDSWLRGYAIAVLQDAESGAAPGGSAAVAENLRQVSDVTGRTPALAEVLTDVDVAVPARRAIAEDLLTAKVVAPALRLVLKAITAEAADFLLSVLIELTDLATQFTDLGWAEFEAQEPHFGRIGARKLSAGYAACVFEDVGPVTELEQIEEELFSFAEVVRANPGLRSALSDSSRPVGDRRVLVSGLLDGKVSAATIRLARAALFGRSRDPVGSIEWMAERAAEARGWRVARVTSARGLDDAERAEISRALQELAGAPVELLVTEDAELLGGAVIALGNVLVDASVQHRLDQLHEQLLGPDRLVG
jgi:F-type H+-transporting ATPase subunit delta